MNEVEEKEAAIAIVDFGLIPIVFFTCLFIIATIVEKLLNPNIESFKLIFVAISGIPFLILYFRSLLKNANNSEF